jgi:putative ABC transport system permease protein
MPQVLSASLALPRFVMLLLSTFAVLAVALAAVGVYGMMSYVVTQRTHEIGVRMALGAVPRDVLRLVIGRALLLTGGGVVIGLAGARALTRLLESQLYGVQPTDSLTFTAVTAGLVLVALTACYAPRVARHGWIPWWHCGMSSSQPSAVRPFGAG